MFRTHLFDNIPVNLIQQPIERTLILVWLIAFAQFVSYGFTNAMTPTLSWLLTAPALMVASMLIAIRLQNSLPLAVTFLSGIMVILFYLNGELSSALLWQNVNTHQGNSNLVNSLMGISVYALLFWLLSSRFLASRYFMLMQGLLQSGNENINTHPKFKTFLFYLTFFTLNICVAISLFNPGYFTLIHLAIAMLFLFIAGKHISQQLRGVLLPVYVTMMLASHLISLSASEVFMTELFSSQTFSSQLSSINPVFNINSISFMFWALLLWIGHNFISVHYNKLFPELKITTMLWPWFGLLLFIAITFSQAPETFYQPFYLAILTAYLFLMLRNTTLPLISWSIILLVSWLVLVVLSPINPKVFSFTYFSQPGYYGLQSLFFTFALLVFNELWERYIKHYFIALGWKKISFRKPVLTVSCLVATLWLVANFILATGLVSGWFNLINEGLFIEKTSLFVVVAFLALYYFINNKLLANLVHFSAILLLIVFWGFNKAMPVYTLFAVIHLLWVILPTVLNWLSDRLSSSNQRQYSRQLIETSANWIYISFVAAIISLFHLADSHHAGMDSFVFLASIGILFLASILLAKRYSHQLWIVFSYLLATGLLLSFRFMTMGTVPLNAYDTTGLLLISFLLFAVNRFGALPSPIINSDTLVKLLPLTAVFTISWQSGSIHSSITLLILGIFYLLIEKGSRVTLYSGFAFINLSVYLWMPLLSDYTNLLLFYIIPVSISLLLITHLHRNEMKPALINKIRFVALSLLYIVVATDIFINETLVVFLLGLLLGLASVIYGISQKTRAFLYTGVSFLVVIILGQLIVLYPEGRLGRALILMMTGAIITGTMIWFNIKREMLLSRIRLFRADLDRWN